MKKLRISHDLSLPLDTVTSTLIAYGGKGMGKTNLGSVWVEELTRCGLRWAWLDPLGVSFGLRHSADGAGRGVECLILGGLHGDVPIEPAGGAAVADVVVEESTNVLIDFSRKTSGEMWSIADKIRFVTDYALRLFQRQGEMVDGRRREPLFQVLDEAARYIPQTIPAGEPQIAKCVGAWNQLVEEGRNVGVGVGLLTQRSARMSKSVSELADAMFAFRTVGPNSLAAILEWLGEHVEKARIKDLAEKVRGLERGHALVVSPGWLKFEGVVEIRMRETFDSSATVKHGERQRTARGEGAKPDLAKIRERMAAFVERAKAEDPRELRKTIAELRAQVKKLESAKPATAAKGDPAAQRRDAARIQALKKALEVAMKFVLEISAEGFFKAAGDKVDPAEIQKALDAALRNITKVIEQRLDGRNQQIERLQREAQRVARALKAIADQEDVTVQVNVRHQEPFAVTAPPAPRPAPRRAPANPDARVTPAQQRILDALAWLESVGISSANKTQLALLADASPTSSSYANNLGSLRSAGLIDYGAGATAFLTEAGRGAAAIPDSPPTADALQESILRRLEPAKGRILRALIRVYPQGLARDALADLASASATSSSYANNLGALRSLGLIDYRAGEVVALPVLFLEGAA